jgi:hypothetical protein
MLGSVEDGEHSFGLCAKARFFEYLAFYSWNSSV